MTRLVLLFVVLLCVVQLCIVYRSVFISEVVTASGKMLAGEMLPVLLCCLLFAFDISVLCSIPLFCSNLRI